VIRLHISPAPTADEAAAIEAAITSAIRAATAASTTATATRLRYGDVACSAAHPRTQANNVSPLLGWREVARLESLEPGV
jgi:hypothetical protein